MSFLGVKVILFLVIPLIIKEKSNASALTSTVMNMENGRCETTFSMLSLDKKIGFKHFSHSFWEMITWERNNKSNKGTTRTTLLTPMTMGKILFSLFPCGSMLSSIFI